MRRRGKRFRRSGGGYRLALLGAALLSLLAAATVYFYAAKTYERLVVTRPLVVAAAPIPPYTRITADLVEVRELPALLAEEPIHLETSEVLDRITTSAIPEGSPLYHGALTSPAEFHPAAPHLEIISIAVNPVQAVGGALQRGQRANVYYVDREPRASTTPLAALSGSRALAAERLTSASVVSVREVAVDCTSSGGGGLQIVTLAVPAELAPRLVALAAEQGTGSQLWLSLAPLVPLPEGQEVVATNGEAEIGVRGPGASVLPTVHSTWTAEIPLSPSPALPSLRVVTGTSEGSLNVRHVPSLTVTVGSTLQEGAAVEVLEALVVEDRLWVRVRSGETYGWAVGSYLLQESP